ncbi:helix-turn-helix domain-containing protein [bacterium]|nr:helix-turn-helix domain-containing protein [bacterium]
MAPDPSIYQTPGAMIRAARMARGLGLQDLAAETRIPDRLLAAIENDDFDQLSGALYARSFLRSCGQSLGLDPARLLESYERLLTEREPDVPPDQTWEEETTVQRVGVLPWHRIAIVAGAVALALLLVWAVLGIFGGDDTPADPATQPAAGEVGTTADAAEEDAHAVEVDADADTGDEAPRTVRDETPAELPPPARTETRREADPDLDQDDGDVSPSPAALAALASLPRGDPSLVFDDGESWPLVLCVVTEARVDFAVGSDGDREASDVAWPAQPAHGVPSEGVVAGRLYMVGGRYVAYWGAADHFLLRLTRAEDVTVVLNGTALAIPERSVGREWVLDRSQLGP